MPNPAFIHWHKNHFHPLTINVNHLHPLTTNVNYLHPLTTNENHCHPVATRLNHCETLTAKVNHCHPVNPITLWDNPRDIPCHFLSTNVNHSISMLNIISYIYCTVCWQEPLTRTIYPHLDRCHLSAAVYIFLPHIYRVQHDKSILGWSPMVEPEPSSVSKWTYCQHNGWQVPLLGVTASLSQQMTIVIIVDTSWQRLPKVDNGWLQLIMVDFNWQ